MWHPFKAAAGTLPRLWSGQGLVLCFEAAVWRTLRVAEQHGCETHLPRLWPWPCQLYVSKLPSGNLSGCFGVPAPQKYPLPPTTPEPCVSRWFLAFRLFDRFGCVFGIESCSRARGARYAAQVGFASSLPVPLFLLLFLVLLLFLFQERLGDSERPSD